MTLFVLTLVHGTWGRGALCASGDAPWTKDDSTLCRSLRGRFGTNVVFRRFRWSGGNSHTARFDAARKLRACLRKGLTQWPDATHIVIAHSHGGNVALSALKDSELRDKIAGVACLATPFISARQRDIGHDPSKTLAFALLVPVITFVWVFIALLPASWGDFERMGFAVLIGPLLMSVFVLLLKGAREHARRLHNELTPGLPKYDQLLIVRSPADEASSALSMFQFISQLTVRSFLVGRRCVAGIERLANHWAKHKRRVVLFAFAALVVCVILLITYVELVGQGASKELATAALAGCGISAVVFAAGTYLALPFLGPDALTLPFRLLLSALLWPVIATLSIVLVLPFGWQAALVNILLDVTAETTPTGSWKIHLIEPPTSEELETPVPPLMHKVYENPHVHTRLGEWIETRGVSV